MKKLLVAILPCLLLTACLNTNRQIKVVPSPLGTYQVQVRECQVRGSLTRDIRYEVFVTRAGADEQCYSAKEPVLATFLSPSPVEKLTLTWVSDTELRVGHPAPSYWPPQMERDRKKGVTVTFEPAQPVGKQ